jgi:hypothetical protein
MRTLLAVAMAAFVFIPPDAEKSTYTAGVGAKGTSATASSRSNRRFETGVTAARWP